MIIFGIRMKGKDDIVPKEVFEWLKEKNEKYPNIDFMINFSLPTKEEQLAGREHILKYSRFFLKEAPYYRITTVIFPYITESWNVKIIGLENEKGEILNPDSIEYNNGESLSRKLSWEIAGAPDPDLLEFISGHVFGVPRKENESVLEKPIEMISLKPDYRW